MSVKGQIKQLRLNDPVVMDLIHGEITDFVNDTMQNRARNSISGQIEMGQNPLGTVQTVGGTGVQYDIAFGSRQTGAPTFMNDDDSLPAPHHDAHIKHSFVTPELKNMVFTVRFNETFLKVNEYKNDGKLDFIADEIESATKSARSLESKAIWGDTSGVIDMFSSMAAGSVTGTLKGTVVDGRGLEIGDIVTYIADNAAGLVANATTAVAATQKLVTAMVLEVGKTKSKALFGTTSATTAARDIALKIVSSADIAAADFAAGAPLNGLHTGAVVLGNASSFGNSYNGIKDIIDSDKSYLGLKSDIDPTLRPAWFSAQRYAAAELNLLAFGGATAADAAVTAGGATAAGVTKAMRDTATMRQTAESHYISGEALDIMADSLFEDNLEELSLVVASAKTVRNYSRNMHAVTAIQQAATAKDLGNYMTGHTGMFYLGQEIMKDNSCPEGVMYLGDFKQIKWAALPGDESGFTFSDPMGSGVFYRPNNSRNIQAHVSVNRNLFCTDLTKLGAIYEGKDIDAGNTVAGVRSAVDYTLGSVISPTDTLTGNRAEVNIVSPTEPGTMDYKNRATDTGRFQDSLLTGKAASNTKSKEAMPFSFK